MRLNNRLYVLQKIQDGNSVKNVYLHRKTEYRKYLKELPNASLAYKVILINQLKHLNKRFTNRLLKRFTYS